jgi:hypothetical protein
MEANHPAPQLPAPRSPELHEVRLLPSLLPDRLFDSPAYLPQPHLPPGSRQLRGTLRPH